MHTLRNRILFFGSALGVGFASLALHGYMMETYVDDKGLLIPWNLPMIFLWVLMLGYGAVLLFLVGTLGGDGSYADCFPKCLLSGGLMIAAGGLLARAIPQMALVLDGQSILAQLLPWLAAGSMVVLGGCRMMGKKPSCVFSCTICLFYILMLVSSYRLWSADPQLQDYAYQLLGGVLLMLCSFHRTSCDAGVIQRKKLLFTGLTASVCCLVSLGGGYLWGYYLASGLWAAGSMCSPAVFPPDPEEDEGELSAEPEMIPEETEE